MAVLDRMIARRHELANLVGFTNWADYITADKMVGSGKNASMFIDRVVEASKTMAAKEYQTLLTRKQKDVPGDEHRSEEHTSELQSLRHLVCRLLLEKKKPIHDMRDVT